MAKVNLLRNFLLWMKVFFGVACLYAASIPAHAELVSKTISGVPEYLWAWGCFGTAAGMVGGYWDRHSFSNIYTGGVNGGVAPLNSSGGNAGIHALWATKKGVDGRTTYGHVDDYYGAHPTNYERTNDPYIAAGRVPHADDCIGDFIGLSQWGWTNMNGECDGNINAWAFNYFAQDGSLRINFETPLQNGVPVKDFQSGMRNWMQWRGYNAEVFSQLCELHPHAPTGTGFTFDDLVAEIDAGFPLLLYLQNSGYSRTKYVPNVNPGAHGMVAYGYSYETDGTNKTNRKVKYLTSWSGQMRKEHAWSTGSWEASLALRGVIGFRPQHGIHQTATNNLFAPTSTWWNVYSTGQTISADAVIAASNTTWHFVGWTQDGLRITNATGHAINPLTNMVMTNSYSLEAQYLPREQDEDANGLEDWWEWHHFGTLGVDPDDDADGDGLANKDELLAGTDPLDVHDFFVVHVNTNESLVADPAICWRHIESRTYIVSWADGTLANGEFNWQGAVTNPPLAITNGTACWRDTNLLHETSGAARIYRITVEQE